MDNYPRRRTYGRSRPKYTRSGIAAYTGGRGAQRNYPIVASRRRSYYRVRGRSTGALVATPENKYFDTTKAGTAMTSTAASWAGGELDPAAGGLFSPIIGSGISNRIGRKVVVTKIKLKGVLRFTAATGGTSVSDPPFARIMLVQDKQTNAQAGINAEDVMQSAGTANVANQLMTHQNLANFGRFRVIKDKTYAYHGANSANDAAANTVSTDFDCIPFKWNVTFKKPVVVHFNATNGGTNADIVDHSFHVIGMATSASCAITYECRVVYVDN